MFQLTNLSPKDQLALAKAVGKGIDANITPHQWCERAWESPNPLPVTTSAKASRSPIDKIFVSMKPVIASAKAAGLTLEQLSALAETLGTEITEARKAQELEKARKAGYVEGQNGGAVSSSPPPGISSPNPLRAHIVSLRPARNSRGGPGGPGAPKDKTKQLEFELKPLESPERTPEQLAEAEARAKEEKEQFQNSVAHCEITPEELAARAAAAKLRKREECLAKIRAEVGPRRKKKI